MTWTRGRIAGASCAVAAALVLVALAVTYVLSSRAMAQVSAVPDEVECTRAGVEVAERPAFLPDVTTSPGEDNLGIDPPSPGFQVVDDGRDVKCLLRVFVRNDGDRAVTLRSLQVGWWGSGGGGAFRADDLGGSTTTPHDVSDDASSDSDAAWDVDETIESGDFTWVEIGFVRRGEICRDGGYLEQNLPSMQLSSLGWHATVSTRLTIASRSVEPVGCNA